MDLLPAIVGVACGLLAGPALARAATVPSALPEPDAWALATITAMAAASGGLIAGKVGWSTALPAFILFALTGVALALVDIERQRLPYRLVLPLYGFGLLTFAAIAVTSGSVSPIVRSIGAATVVGGFFLALALALPGQLGLGDVVLAGAIALYLGWLGWQAVATGVLAGLLLGALVSVVLLALRRGRKSFALGPALLAGWLLGVLAS